MSAAYARAVRAMSALCHRFGPDDGPAKQAALQRLAALPLAATPALLRHHGALLFLAAHPASAEMARGADAELLRLAAFVKAQRGAWPAAWDNQGLPHAPTLSRFSHDLLRWLQSQADVELQLDAWRDGSLDLNAVLRLTLPPLERADTTAGLDNDALLQRLRVPRARRLAVVLAELARLDDQPFVKDLLFEQLDAWVRVQPRSRALSKAFNRLPLAQPLFVQTELLRRFDPAELMGRRLPRPRALDATGRDAVLGTVRRALLLMQRETDPATYANPRTLRVYDLERGLSVVLLDMEPARQLPLESYVGFMLFKNGLAVAYGGAWMLGERAAFGMNIFESYRGGESGFMMCQVLRAYRQSFDLRHIEVDAYQFGLDNPDGIASGAYWFYHRHGFRSLDPALARLAEREQQRMRRQPGHRSSARTLQAFTGSSVALTVGSGPPPPALHELTEPVTAWIARQHQGDRAAAEADARQAFADAGLSARAWTAPGRAALDMALLAAAHGVREPAARALLAAMARAKPLDAWRYQRLLTRWLRSLQAAG